MKTRDLTLMAVFIALITAGTFIRIPLPLCPLTLQPLFTTLAGVMLGRKRGFGSVAGYVLLGLMGLPVFTGGGGIGYVLQPTFGFLVGYCVSAWVAGSVAETGEPTVLRLSLGGMAGLIAVYGIGLVYYWIIYRFYLGTFQGFRVMLLNCFLLPLPKDLLSCVLAGVLGKRLMPVIRRIEQGGTA